MRLKDVIGPTSLRWRGMRSERVLLGQLELAVAALQKRAGVDVTILQAARHVPKAVLLWKQEGLSPATITKRLNCLALAGVNVKGCRPRKSRSLKWWLKPSDEARLCAALRQLKEPYPEVADYIEFITRTGLRIEEALRLRWSDVEFRIDRRDSGDCSDGGQRWATVTVPGLKTATAQATLPVGPEALAILERRYGREVSGPVFSFIRPRSRRKGSSEAEQLRTTYWWLAHTAWSSVCLPLLGNPKNATLKALRRSAARYLHVQRGMPLDVLRQYLRHEDMETTMGYLRLVGGYNEAEMRKWL